MSTLTIDIHPDDLERSPHCVQETHELGVLSADVRRDNGELWLTLDAKFYGVSVSLSLDDETRQRLIDILTNKEA